MEIVISKSTTVKAIKDQFHKEYGGVLMIYDSDSDSRLWPQAADDVTLVSIGAKEGTYDCHGSKRLGEFCYDMFEKFNLLVKVYPDKWNIFLFDVSLSEIRYYIKAMHKRMNSKEIDR